MISHLPNMELALCLFAGAGFHYLFLDWIPDGDWFRTNLWARRTLVFVLLLTSIRILTLPFLG
jgi:hypothetical protein